MNVVNFGEDVAFNIYCKAYTNWSYYFDSIWRHTIDCSLCVMLMRDVGKLWARIYLYLVFYKMFL